MKGRVMHKYTYVPISDEERTRFRSMFHVLSLKCNDDSAVKDMMNALEISATDVYDYGRMVSRVCIVPITLHDENGTYRYHVKIEVIPLPEPPDEEEDDHA